jgi:uncharacterized HAD superfamily protein
VTLSFKNMLKAQKKFSDEFFTCENLSEFEKIEMHKTFCLALHDEVSQMSDAVHYKHHRDTTTPTNRQKILYENVDIIRYCLATLNLWEFKDEDFLDAFDAKDASLWDGKEKSIEKWAGQPTIIVDVDDVIARFRETFFNWMNETFDLKLSVNSTEYYYSGMAGNLTGEEAFMKFIDESMIRAISVNRNIVKDLERLREEGYWIQLLTARPSDIVKCKYDTYSWLKLNNIPYDSVAFSYEKYRWLSDKSFFKAGKVVCAIDDSPKHAAEYASHGIPTLVPKRSYNEKIWTDDNIFTFDWENDSIFDAILLAGNRTS